MAPPTPSSGALFVPVAALGVRAGPPDATTTATCSRRAGRRRYPPTAYPTAPRRRWPRRTAQATGIGAQRLPPQAAATHRPAGPPLREPSVSAGAAEAPAPARSPPPRQRRWGVRFPTAPDDRALVVGVVLCLALTAIIWLAGGRLAGVPIRLDRTAPFDYPWRLRGRPGGEDAAAAAAAAAAASAGAAVRRWSAWVLYALHQVCHWVLIGATRAQRQRRRQGVAVRSAWPLTGGDRATKSNGGGVAGAVETAGPVAAAGALRRRSSRLPRSIGWPQRATLAVHAAFCSARVAHTHLLSYDGLAADVPEITSLAAVALLLVWVWLLEAPRRGVVAGTRPPRALTATALRATAVATHGYYFSFATIYTLWYHPAASTVAHLSGFLYVFLLLLQSSLAGTAAHGRRWWTFALEGWVAVHALVTAATVGGGRLVPLFGWGLATSFMAVHLHGFGLRRRVRAAVAAAYACGAAVAVGVGWRGTRGWHLVAIPTLLYPSLGGLVLVLAALTAVGRAVRARRQARAGTAGKRVG